MSTAAQRLWRMLRRGDRVERVGRRAARVLDHARRVGVQADGQGVGTRSRSRQHVAAVARPEVDGEAVVARRQRVESADVDVVEAAASEHTDHASSLSDLDTFPTLGPGNSLLAAPNIARIDGRDVLSLLAGAFALLGLILLTVGALMPQVLVLLAGAGALAGGAGTLAGQRRRARARV